MRVPCVLAQSLLRARMLASACQHPGSAPTRRLRGIICDLDGTLVVSTLDFTAVRLSQ